MVSKKITNILLWLIFVCWIIILPVLIYCDSDKDLNINVAFGSLFEVFFQLISALTGKAFNETLIQQPYIVAIFSAVILFLISLLWLIPCLKAKKRKTMIISAVSLAIINIFFMIMFIVMYSTTIKVGDYSFGLYVEAVEQGYSVYQTPFIVILPFALTTLNLIPYIIRIVNDGKDKQAKNFNIERKAAINLSKGQIGATDRQAVKSMVSNQELKNDPSSVSDLKSKVNRLKSQLENKDYTNSFNLNSDSEMASKDNDNFNENGNDQVTGYIPTSELFIRPPRVNQDDFKTAVNINSNRNDHLNFNSYEEEDTYDNNDLLINQNKVNPNFIYPTTAKNRLNQQQTTSSSQLARNQYPYNTENGKALSPRVNRAVVDSKYNNKIVIGDTDKIWDATKKARQQYSKSNDKDEQEQ